VARTAGSRLAAAATPVMSAATPASVVGIVRADLEERRAPPVSVQRPHSFGPCTATWSEALTTDNPSRRPTKRPAPPTSSPHVPARTSRRDSFHVRCARRLESYNDAHPAAGKADLPNVALTSPGPLLPASSKGEYNTGTWPFLPRQAALPGRSHQARRSRPARGHCIRARQSDCR
jgi:hypothetical protein